MLAFGSFALRRGDLRWYRDVLVHPTQEMRDPDGAFFRGGPQWPRFHTQILARHCRGMIPRPIDAMPLTASAHWPYFDRRFLPLFWPQLGVDPLLPAHRREEAIDRLASIHEPLPQQRLDRVEAGIWCGPISLHFGETIAAWGMRIAGSGEADPALPLVFSLPPLRGIEPMRFFWDMLDHLAVDRRRVLLVRTPTRFGRLAVLPQAERLYGGGPDRRHLQMLDAIGARNPVEHDIGRVFVSRSQMADGRFAGEGYLDGVLGRAGVTVFHPESTDLETQLRLYRRAHTLIFSEGSAVHALQLLGHLDCDLVVLARRPRYRIAAASLRPRVRTLRYVPVRALIYGLSRSGRPMLRGGISLFDEKALLSALRSLGVDVTRLWDERAHLACRDNDIAAWLAQQAGPQRHPHDAAFVNRQLRALGLSLAATPQEGSACRRVS